MPFSLVSMMSSDPTKRFSNRVNDYVKYRPGYPAEVIRTLQQECNLPANAVIADIGSGTGIFTAMLLQQGYQVYAVEPNNDMQQAAVQYLGHQENFKPVSGTAAATTLNNNSIDLIVCAQAFHWFNNNDTRTEFNRILVQDGYVALIWNNRLTNADDFATEYDALLKLDSIDYNKVNHQNISDIDFKLFFRDGIYKEIKFPNLQVFDEDGLIGRAFSSSYVPAKDTDEGKAFLKLLRQLFEKYNKNGKVNFHYQTEIYLGRV